MHAPDEDGGYPGESDHEDDGARAAVARVAHAGHGPVAVERDHHQVVDRRRAPDHVQARPQRAHQATCAVCEIKW